MNQDQTLLLVDDSENDRFLVRSVFEKEGFKIAVHEVHDGAQAIAYLKGEGKYADRIQYPLPSIMLMDLHMPQKNGFEVLSWARAQDAFKSLSIIVMTASAQPIDVQKSFDLGASSYLVKPIRLNELAAMMTCLRDWSRMNHFPPRNDMVIR
jgi:CheY-like chemotaxis protein